LSIVRAAHQQWIGYLDTQLCVFCWEASITGVPTAIGDLWCSLGKNFRSSQPSAGVYHANGVLRSSRTTYVTSNWASILKTNPDLAASFGSFDLNYRHSSIGRNPKSGEKVEVPMKTRPHFKAGKELRERIDRGCAATSKLDYP